MNTLLRTLLVGVVSAMLVTACGKKSEEAADAMKEKAAEAVDATKDAATAAASAAVPAGPVRYNPVSRPTVGGRTVTGRIARTRI